MTEFDKLLDNKNDVGKHACEEIANVCSTINPREACGGGEKRFADYMADKLSGICDEVKQQEFKAYPDAFVGGTYVCATLGILSLTAYFFSTLVSVLFALLGLSVYLVQFVFNKRFFDALYTSKTSRNLSAVKKCAEDIRHRVVFVANLDAPREYKIIYHAGGAVFTTIAVATIIGYVYVLAIDVVRWIFIGGIGAQIASGAMLICGLVGIIFVPAWFALYFMLDRKKTIDGANENLSGCQVVYELLNEMNVNDVMLKNTEVVALFTGSSTIGERGAMAWCEGNSFDDVPTTFVVFDTLREVEHMQINTVEGFKKNDKNVVEFVKKCADSANIDCKTKALKFGVTDSAIFSQHGCASVSITAYNEKCPQYLHTRYDSSDNTSATCISNAYAMACKILQKIEEE